MVRVKIIRIWPDTVAVWAKRRVSTEIIAGALGWFKWLSIFWFQLKLWSQSCEINHAGHGACLRFSHYLLLPLPYSLSLKKKKKERKRKRKNCKVESDIGVWLVLAMQRWSRESLSFCFCILTLTTKKW